MVLTPTPQHDIRPRPCTRVPQFDKRCASLRIPHPFPTPSDPPNSLRVFTTDGAPIVVTEGVAASSEPAPRRALLRGHRDRRLAAPPLNLSGSNTIVVVVLGFRGPGGVLWPSDFGDCGSGNSVQPTCVVAAVTSNMWTEPQGSVAGVFSDSSNGFTFSRPDAVRCLGGGGGGVGGWDSEGVRG